MTRLGQGLDKWLASSLDALARVARGPVVDDIGRVEQVADGIALVSGLPNLGMHELMQTESGHFGFALTLDADRVGCVLLDAEAPIGAGQEIRGTGEVIRTRIGPSLLGRVVDPLGRPLDGLGPLGPTEPAPIEQPAPSVIDRDLITEQVLTGTLAVDSMFPLGRGQRELIVGDRATGKTAIAVDAIINQRRSDMICIYVAIGQKSVGVRRVIDAIHRFGAPERSIIVVAGSSSAPGLQWLAPFAAFTMAEYFRDRGQHALVVLDDLSKHAATHRELALLTRQPPGREAYPGDVFYLHARLLERAAKLSALRGGGSLTALPIVETDNGNLSGYIPTNIISITDGQLVLDTKLFDEGQKPAIDIGRSVSRVGGKTQGPALRQLADTLRLDYAQFMELEVFTRLGGAAEAHVRKVLERGRRTKRLLAQAQYRPFSLLEQVAMLSALRTGALDDVEPAKIGVFVDALLALLDEHQGDISADLTAHGRSSPVDAVEIDHIIGQAKTLLQGRA